MYIPTTQKLYELIHVLNIVKENFVKHVVSDDGLATCRLWNATYCKNVGMCHM